MAFGVIWLAASPSAWGQGFVVITGDDADDRNHCTGDACGNLFPNLLSEAIAQSRSGGHGILAIGANSHNALAALQSWNMLGPDAPITHLQSEQEIADANFSDFAMIYVASSHVHTYGGITVTQVVALNLRQADVQQTVRKYSGR